MRISDWSSDVCSSDLNSPGMAPIRDGEVTYADLDRVLEAAKAVAIPSDQKILHAIAQEYIVDNSQEGIRHPVGMSGVRLEVRGHLVVGARSAAQNISKRIKRCNLQVDALEIGRACEGKEGGSPCRSRGWQSN